LNIARTYPSSFPSRLKGTTAADMKQGRRRKIDKRETIMAGSEQLTNACSARWEESTDCCVDGERKNRTFTRLIYHCHELHLRART
jgi:hypothetical protein